MAPDPTPPHPTTTTVSPGLTLARSTAEPNPVEMPQLMSAAAFMSADGSMRTSEFSWQTISSANVPSCAIRFRSSPAEVVPVRPVADHSAGQRGQPEIAQVLAAGRAPVARPARGDEGHRDVVPHSHLGHIGADLGHDARTLVTTDEGEHGGHPDHLEYLGWSADVAGAHVLVGVAQSRIGHLHPDLPVGRRVDLDLLGLPRLVQPRADHRTCHLPQYRPPGSARTIGTGRRCPGLACPYD